MYLAGLPVLAGAFALPLPESCSKAGIVSAWAIVAMVCSFAGAWLGARVARQWLP